MSPESEKEVFVRLKALEASTAALGTTTTAMNKTVESMFKRLFGNDEGDDGIIGKLKTRVSRLEFYLALAIGGGTVVVWIGNAALSHLK